MTGIELILVSTLLSVSIQFFAPLFSDPICEVPRLNENGAAYSKYVKCKDIANIEPQPNLNQQQAIEVKHAKHGEII